MNYYNYYDYFTRNNDENNIIKDYGDNPFVININDITKLKMYQVKIECMIL